MHKALVVTAFATIALLRSMSGETSLTVYNDDFAIIRDSLKLDLQAGLNDVRYSDVALFVEPSSVILRDPGGKIDLQIQEQAFRGSAVKQETMLAWFEGQTIDFSAMIKARVRSFPKDHSKSRIRFRPSLLA